MSLLLRLISTWFNYPSLRATCTLCVCGFLKSSNLCRCIMNCSKVLAIVSTAARSISARKFSSHPLVGLLGRLNHVAIATPDLDKSAKFYQDLGAKVSEKVPQPEHGVYTVFVELPNTKLELLHPYGDNSPIQAFLDKNKQGGMHHICIEVNHIDKAVAEVKKLGIRTLAKETKIGAHGKPVMFLHPKDCGGVLVELEQE
uniref:Methylmalonyl-CoA epimerase, mitochondrial n=1 Tax=Ascaris suum TaxID=6253 RepID=F1LD17_ASCSU